MRISLRASSPIWASEESLARLASLAQIGELARRLNADQANPKTELRVFGQIQKHIMNP